MKHIEEESVCAVIDDANRPETEQNDGFPPIDFPEDNGGNHATCDWNDTVCVNVPEYYIRYVCDDPCCKERHICHYCKRHYLLRLGMTMHALRQHADEYRSARSSEERRVMTLRVITDFGRIG